MTEQEAQGLVTRFRCGLIDVRELRLEWSIVRARDARCGYRSQAQEMLATALQSAGIALPAAA